MRAVVEDIAASHAKGQPVLVGTITIDMSEELSRMLKKQGIKHNVLNAKFHERRRRSSPMQERSELSQSLLIWRAVVPILSWQTV